MRDIVVDKAAGRVWASVAEKNCKFLSRIRFLLEVITHLTPFHPLHPPPPRTSLFPLSPPVGRKRKSQTNSDFFPTEGVHIIPVSLAVEVFTILHHGRKANLALARFTQERGAKSSFGRVLEALESVLMARGFLVEDEGRKTAMVSAL